MSKEIKVEEAKSWSQEEATSNLAYLDARSRGGDVDRVRELRGEESSPPAEHKPPTQEDVAAAQPMDINKEAPGVKAQSVGTESVFDTSTMTVDQVLDMVGDDENKAQQALDSESSRGEDARKTLVEKLEGITE